MSRRKGFISELKGKTKHRPRLCLCGCGQYTPLRIYNKRDGQGCQYWAGFWIKGHFSSETRYKMSLARRGKEPTNKILIDIAFSINLS